MLGLAISEAEKSRQIGLKLKHEKQSKDRPSPDDIGFRKPRNRRRRAKKPQAPGNTSQPHQQQLPASLARKQHDAPITRSDIYFCLRCGMVQTTAVDEMGEPKDALGRVTLVNWDNQCVLDAFVRVPVSVLDHRTANTGITPEALNSQDAMSFEQVRQVVGYVVNKRILVGHGLEVDLDTLRLQHPWCDLRDIATYAPYMKEEKDALTVMLLPRDLRSLSVEVLQRYLSPGPFEEAVACLDLYKSARGQWEAELIEISERKRATRERVVRMRSGPPLGSIQEDEAEVVRLVDRPPIQHCCKPYRGLPNFPEDSSLESTAPSTAVTSTAWQAGRLSYCEENSTGANSCTDDDTISSQTLGSDVCSSISSYSINSRSLTPSKIENMDDLRTRFAQLPSRTESWGRDPSRASSEETIWRPSTNHYIASAVDGRSQNSASSPIIQAEPPRSHEVLSSSLTEKDLLDHLPATLIEDLYSSNVQTSVGEVEKDSNAQGSSSLPYWSRWNRKVGFSPARDNMNRAGAHINGLHPDNTRVEIPISQPAAQDLATRRGPNAYITHTRTDPRDCCLPKPSQEPFGAVWSNSTSDEQAWLDQLFGDSSSTAVDKLRGERF